MDEIIQLKFDIAATRRMFNRISRQTDFAVARAIGGTVNFARREARERASRYLHLRTEWIKNSVVTGPPPTKDNLVGVVGIRRGQRGNDLAPVLVEGGVKMPHGSTQAIPKKGTDANIKFPRGEEGERTTPQGRNWPGQYLEQIRKMAELRDAMRHSVDSKELRKLAGIRKRTKGVKAGLVFLQHAAIPTIAIRVGKKTYKPLWYLLDRPVTIGKKWPFIDEAIEDIQSVLPVATMQFLSQILSEVRTT